MYYVKRMVCGGWGYEEEFMVPLNDTVRHQWYKLSYGAWTDS
ncbi:hypothetical protein PPOP_2725 [Paenibacillus popilliae ATCC 14706]|uniref:Uncharacterized protein n=1 Tax=Paenibacillus popilliae ATCC 14706 TaxID=1212764 RepID=M9M6W1_PAEPP|nr:hypothetical protein PPOP_2725 [Paenibacillus popilliae ATCC 14706]